jgi:hypothetical protein
MTARDLAEGSGFAYEAPEMTIAVEAVSAEGEAVPMEASVTLEEVSGSYDVTEGETRAIDSTFDAATLALALSASELEGGEGALTLAVDMADITSTSQGSGSALFNMADLPAMLADGFETEGTAGFGETTFAFSATGPESLQASGGMSGGGVAVAMSEDQLSYDVSYEGFEFAASGSEIPLPEVTGGIAAWTTGVDMPVRPTEAPAPFGLRLRLEGLTMGEPIWSIFDPAGALPRDPATLILDLSGQMRWLVDIFDEAAMAEAPMPADVTELGLEELRLALLGAELTGEGGVSLDLARAGQGGMPVTGGGATFTLRGGNALLDRLVQMGLLPEEQAMMTRMMTGMIAKPGDGPDTLVSEIEIGPDGTVLANGAPLPF